MLFKKGTTKAKLLTKSTRELCYESLKFSLISFFLFLDWGVGGLVGSVNSHFAKHYKSSRQRKKIAFLHATCNVLYRYQIILTTSEGTRFFVGFTLVWVRKHYFKNRFSKLHRRLPLTKLLS